MYRTDIRNIAIIAHVDHGKTTLVDAMLRQAQVFRVNQVVRDRVLDSNDLERERGITILSKNAAIRYGDVKINIVDTPGHSDFGGEVERVLNMVDGVLLLVDAVDGPMPQTRFVLKKALELGHQAVVVVNKIDRPAARPQEVVDNTFDLFIDLGATDEQADIAVVYTDAVAGHSGLDPDDVGDDLRPLFESILQLPAPNVAPERPTQLLVTSVNYDEYKGRIVVGCLRQGELRRGQEVAILTPDTKQRKAKVAELFIFEKLERNATDSASAGEIVAVAGLENVGIGETITDPESPEPLPPIEVEAPTVRMVFKVSDSPFAGREGTYVTSRPIRARLLRETERNLALRVEETESADTFVVSGRGELHLAILIETMRREGFEFAVGRPEVIFRDIGGLRHEPFEDLYIDVGDCYVGAAVDLIGRRRGQLIEMNKGVDGTTSMTFLVPTRGLLGFRNQFLTATAGTGVMHTLFHGYLPTVGDIAAHETGSLVAHEPGTTTAFALNNAQERGSLFLGPGVDVYTGMIVGRRARAGDLPINVCKRKHVTNHRRSFAEEGITLTPPIPLTLDAAIEYIREDELVEVTPESIRLRKRVLDYELRLRASRKLAKAPALSP